MLYLIKSNKFLKIGYTSNLNNRIKQYKTHNPDIKVLSIIDGTREDEKKLHELCKEWKYDSEWFYYSPKIIDLFLNHNQLDLCIVRESIVKTYNEFIPKLCQFKKKLLFDVLFKLVEWSENNTMKIILNKSIYEQLASDLNRTYKTIKSTIKDLIKDELIVQYKNDYIINPQYFWKGNDISRQLLLSDLQGTDFE